MDKTQSFTDKHAEGPGLDDDNEKLMDHCALEMMHSINSKDHKAFRDSFHVLVAHTLNKMGVEGDE